MTLVEEDLGGEVLGSAAEGESAALDLLGETEVGQLYVPILCDQDVLRFEIPINYISGM
jgi:hypothetical protein